MENGLEHKKRVSMLQLSITKQTLANICFIMFFSGEVVSFISSRTLKVCGLEEYEWIITSIIIYFPVLLMPFFTEKKRKVYDFGVLLISLILGFAITILAHPEYRDWFNHSLYGVFNYVLKPYRAIYAYFVIRICDNPKEILKNLKVVAFILLIYGLYRFKNAMQVGYWLTLTEGGYRQLSYSMDFGYDMMLSTIIFLYYAMVDKKIIYMVISVISVILILVAGSRAPLLWIAVFFCIMVIRNYIKSRYKLIWGMCIPICLLIYVNLEKIMMFVISMFDRFGISSRSLQMLLLGTLGDDNGRKEIFNIAIDMIKNSDFLGYGLYGDRYVIGNYYYWGYPHNIFLEILITFGVVLGGTLIVLLIYYIFKMLLKCKDEHWRDVFLIFMVSSLKLLLSFSYLYVAEFWALIAIMYTWNLKRKKINRAERKKLSYG